ncbi:MAG: PAS domain S-box protein [Rhodospirillales bacterium]
MTDRRTLAALLLAMTVGALAVGGIAIATLYYRERDAWSDRLAYTAESAAEALAEPVTEHPAEMGEAAGLPPRWALPIAADHRITVGRLDGDTLSFMDRSGDWATSAQAAGIELAAAMRRALAGETGVATLAGADGRHFLAAFRPVAGRDLGVVSSVPVDTIGAPFLAAGRNALLFGLPLLILAAVGSTLASRSLLRRGEASRDRSKSLLDRLRTPIIVVRPAGDDFVVADINPAGERMEGVHREDVVGRSLPEMLPATCSPPLLDTLRRVARTGAAATLPAAQPATGNESPWREFSFLRLPDGDVVITADDVTARCRAEEALHESERRWRLIMEMQEQAIVILDPKLDIRFVNKAAETLFAKPSQDLIGVPFGYPLVDSELAEIEILRAHHGVCYAEMRMIPMRWGGVEHYVIFLRDVSAYRRTEGDLRKLFQAIEQSPASVVITDVEGRIEYVNPKFSETTGYTYPEVVGKNPRMLRSGLTASEDYRELWETISAGKVWRGEFYNRRKNGDFFWELAAIAPVRDSRGQITHYVAVKEDISERKATEERLRHSQKMETIGQLTGGLAHDFNNLLAIVIGNLQLLEERGDVNPECRELIADALWSAERGAQLTHRLLAFARRQRLNPERMDLNGVVGEMTGLLRRTIGEKILIHENFASDLWETMVDRSQLENSLLNLVVNARDAMGGDGVLHIRTANIKLSQEAGVFREDTPPGDYVLLEVADSGAGMPPEVLERIFEPFFTTKKLGEGSGLGLSMVYGFVRQSGGQIFVESTPGKGTTIRLCLPKATDIGGDREKARVAGEAVAKGVILVVEDDPESRAAATTILREQGYTVAEAADAASAVNRVQTLDRLDLLFTNVSLPNGRSGLELAQTVLKLRPQTRVLLTSSHTASLVAAEGGWPGDVDPIIKPYRREQLIMRVRAQLDQLGDARPGEKPADGPS